ncbi:MAG TPA: EipA family protein, partial [Gammaproteobacteria bacterium]|nr:EipA family protein [Gammaproteobacteria bacterium]
GYIKGEEVSGALGVGLRYGNGSLTLKKGGGHKVHWTGPSIGFDVGANASKVFVLVYHLPNANAIYQRYPAVEGSFYYVAGAGINYQQRDNIILAPIRVGVGLRGGVNLGYMHYTKEKTWIPF